MCSILDVHSSRNLARTQTCILISHLARFADVNRPNCTWNCATGFQRMRSPSGADQQVCTKIAGGNTGFVFTEEMIVGIAVGIGALVVIAAVILIWCYWRKHQPNVEVVELDRPRVPPKIPVSEPELERGIGTETHTRDLTSPTLLQPRYFF